jgi:hypothetical protein
MEDSLQAAIGRNVYNIRHVSAIGCKAMLYGGFLASHRNPSLIMITLPTPLTHDLLQDAGTLLSDTKAERCIIYAPEVFPLTYLIVIFY